VQGASSALRASVSSSDAKQKRNLAASSLDATKKKIRTNKKDSGGSEEKERQLRYFTYEGSSGGGGNNNNTAPIVDEEDTQEQFTTLEDIVCSSSALSLDDQLSNLCQVFNETSRYRNEMDSTPTVMNPRIIGYSSSNNFDWNLKSGEAFTLFAPINSAFGAPPLETLLPPGLFKNQFLNTHIVNRAISPSELTRNCGFGVPTRFVGETTTTLCDLQGFPLYQVGQGNTISDRPTLIGTALRVLNGQGYIYPIDNFIKPSQFLVSPTIGPMPTPMPVTPPTPAPFDAPIVPPTPEPTVAPSNAFTLSPVAETSSVITGLAAPIPSPARTEDISTVAEFELALFVRIAILLVDSSCIAESSAIQYAASNSVCTEAFTAAQLAGASFCYEFQTTISPPTSGEDCEVNVAAELVAVALNDGELADAIGPVADIAVRFAPTDAPTEGPTSETDLPTSGTTTEGPTSDTEEPTSGTTTEGPTSDTEEPTSGTTTEGPTSEI